MSKYSNLIAGAQDRVIRVFVSSTFRDMQEERDYLAKKVFPRVRAFCKERGIEFLELDLRWGITEKESQSGKVIELCLREIKKCKPYFIGILGERYGWIPERVELDKNPGIISEFKEVEGYIDNGMSVTEIEIQNGALRIPEMRDKAFFCFRVQSSTPEEFREQPESDRYLKLERLKEKIQRYSDNKPAQFTTCQELGDKVYSHFTGFIEKKFPLSEIPSDLEKMRIAHAGFARSRMQVYIGGDKYYTGLDEYEKSETTRPMVITGESGSGKSALLANWIARYQRKYPEAPLIYHFTGGAPGSSSHIELMKRLMMELKEIFEIPDEVTSDPGEIQQAFPSFLNSVPEDKRIVIVLDALNQLDEEGNALWLGWLPESLPSQVRIIISTLPGITLDTLLKNDSPEIIIEPVNLDERKAIIIDTLKLYGKGILPELLDEIVNDKESGNPLILRTLVDEIRIWGDHETIGDRIREYIETDSYEDFFIKVLQRLEQDYNTKNHPDLIREIFSLIWCARDGLSEKEIMDITRVVPLEWSILHNAIEFHLTVSGGLIGFFHDFLRNAVKARYLPDGKQINTYRVKLVEYFDKNRTDTRSLREIPCQLYMTKGWERLADYLTDIPVFMRLYDYNKEQTNLELNRYFRELNKQCNVKDLFRKNAVKQTEYKNWQIYDRIGTFYMAHFHDEFSGECMEKAYKHVKVEEKEDKGNIALVLNNLGYPLYESGKYDEAIKYMKEALKIDEERGASESDIAIRLNNLAQVLEKKGDWKGAEPLYRRALEIRKRVLGKDHLDTASSLNNLAELFRNKGDYEGAEPLQRRALDIRERVLGKDHPDTAPSLNNLALLLSAKGDYEGAEPLLRRALEINEKILGSDHMLTATNLNNLAVLFQDKGNYDRAEPLCRRALLILEKVLGAEHPLVAISMGNLGNILSLQGNHKNAISITKTSVSILERVYDRNHPDTISSRLKLQICLHRANNKDFDLNELKSCTRLLQERNDPRAEKGLIVLRELGEEI